MAPKEKAATPAPQGQPTIFQPAEPQSPRVPPGERQASPATRYNPPPGTYERVELPATGMASQSAAGSPSTSEPTADAGKDLRMAISGVATNARPTNSDSDMQRELQREKCRELLQQAPHFVKREWGKDSKFEWQE